MIATSAVGMSFNLPVCSSACRGRIGDAADPCRGSREDAWLESSLAGQVWDERDLGHGRHGVLEAEDRLDVEAHQ
jgi:hypothetical protein